MADPQQVDSADITNDMHHRYQKWCPMHICTEQTGTTNMRRKLRIKGRKKKSGVIYVCAFKCHVNRWERLYCNTGNHCLCNNYCIELYIHLSTT